MSIASVSQNGQPDKPDLRRHPRRDRTYGIDRLPPYSMEAEQGVIGCLLLAPKECLPEVILAIEGTEAFYDLRHQTIYEAILAVSHKAVDIIQVQQHLKDKQMLEQVGGIAYLSELQDAVPSAANVSYYTEIVREKHTLRKLLATCTNIVSSVYEHQCEIAELLDMAERDMLQVRPKMTAQMDLRQLMEQAVTNIEWKSQNWDKIGGLPTGFPDLDKQTDGLHRGEMIVCAAFPSCGKSALAGNIGTFNALRGNGTGILTAEMRPLQLLIRALCSEARVNYRQMTETDIVKLIDAVKKTSGIPLFLESANGYSIGQVQAAFRRMKQKHGIKLGILDYLQLITGIGDTREQQVTSVSRGIKSTALELDIPILALSQLNDDGKLRESRAIGMDADSVWILQNNGEWQKGCQPVKIRIDKCRDGETGDVYLEFLKMFTRFESSAHVSDQDVPDES
jgi:replicative DNA helicase